MTRRMVRHRRAGGPARPALTPRDHRYRRRCATFGRCPPPHPPSRRAQTTAPTSGRRADAQRGARHRRAAARHRLLRRLGVDRGRRLLRWRRRIRRGGRHRRRRCARRPLHLARRRLRVRPAHRHQHPLWLARGPRTMGRRRRHRHRRAPRRDLLVRTQRRAAGGVPRGRTRRRPAQQHRRELRPALRRVSCGSRRRRGRPARHRTLRAVAAVQRGARARSRAARPRTCPPPRRSRPRSSPTTNAPSASIAPASTRRATTASRARTTSRRSDGPSATRPGIVFGLSYGTRLAQTLMRDSSRRHPAGDPRLGARHRSCAHDRHRRHARRAYEQLFAGCAASAECRAALPGLRAALVRDGRRRSTPSRWSSRRSIPSPPSSTRCSSTARISWAWASRRSTPPRHFAALPEMIDQLERGDVAGVSSLVGIETRQCGVRVDRHLLECRLPRRGTVRDRSGAVPPAAPATNATTSLSPQPAFGAYVDEVCGAFDAVLPIRSRTSWWRATSRR